MTRRRSKEKELCVWVVTSSGSIKTSSIGFLSTVYHSLNDNDDMDPDSLFMAQARASHFHKVPRHPASEDLSFPGNGSNGIRNGFEWGFHFSHTIFPFFFT